MGRTAARALAALSLDGAVAIECPDRDLGDARSLMLAFKGHGGTCRRKTDLTVLRPCSLAVMRAEGAMRWPQPQLDVVAKRKESPSESAELSAARELVRPNHGVARWLVGRS